MPTAASSRGIRARHPRARGSAGRAHDRVAVCKCPDGVEQLVRRLDLREVSRVEQELESRAGYRVRERTALVGVGDVVAVPPNHESGCRNGRQAFGKAGVVHRRPGIDAGTPRLPGTSRVTIRSK
jgi:hypothetical protein